MQKQIFSLHDRAAAAYGPPMFLNTESQAVRALQLELQKPGGLSEFPEDFTLYHIGSFDDNSGLITPQEPQRVISVLEIINKTAKKQPVTTEE